MSSSKDEFVRHYSRALRTGDAALFIGAGMSRPAGFVDWRGLLREIAEDVNLDIDREADLVAVAQYHVNRKRTRARLNEAILHEFTKAAQVTENHRILARLPVSSIWTTNYDTLVEDAIKAAGRTPDVKLTHSNLAQNRPSRDVLVYKMHGDISQPQEAVLTKDDYENYEGTHRLFVEKLKGDLISKTFLFLGFSFTDPNIDYVLSRIRVLLGENQRSHYCIMRQPQRPRGSGKKLAEFDYERRKLELRVEDLQRFAVETVLIDDYSEVEELLKAVSKRAHQRNIFVSGSAHDYGPFGAARLNSLARRIGREIIARDYSLVSGFGHGIGDQVILGAFDALYGVKKGSDVGRTIIRPFPRATGRSQSQEETNRRHREDLISQSGMAVFLCGNREYEGRVENAMGVAEEYRITKDLGRYPIPIACTGFASEEIAKDVKRNMAALFPMRGVQQHFSVLGNSEKSEDKLINALFAIIDKVAIHEG
jgi:hypothetical protein